MRSSDRRRGVAVNPGLEVVVVSGLSGSGKSTAIHVLEDLGYYCIDNLPVVLVPRLLELCSGAHQRLDRVALGIDIRERLFFADYPRVLDELRAAGHRVEVLFLDASDEVLVRRFSETRRPHPLGGDAGPLAGIEQERQALAELRAQADRLIDTTALTVHELRDALRFAFAGAGGAFAVRLVSFGHKHGAPTDADMVLDARFLPNPHFVSALRPHTGQHPAVARFVLDHAETRAFLAHVEALLDFTLPLYRREGRRTFTLAVGCTGGRHRSVALVEHLAARLAAAGLVTQTHHRDVQR